MASKSLFDRESLKKLTKKYEKSLPRYTSYPTAPQWVDADNKFEEEILRESSKENLDLSLYVHVPFCEARCLFCGCNTVISRKKDKAEPYLDNVAKEVDMISKIWKGDNGTSSKVKQIHFGGGTPTFLNPDQLRKLDKILNQNFDYASDIEYSVEIDPEVTTLEQLDTLREIGVNRVSIGIQDFNEDILKRLNRPQKNSWIEKIILHARSLEFTGVNIDLIYGLPGQDIEKFLFSLEKALSYAPDRIALFSYAHVPWIKPHQRSLEKYGIISGFAKFDFFLNALEYFLEKGYAYIGLDHFSKKEDSLNVARESGNLHRNFQGYTTQGNLDMLSFGVSSISSTQIGYWQNPRDLQGYNEKIEGNILPCIRGHKNSPEDLRRRELILEILCHGRYQSAQGYTLEGDILNQTSELAEMEKDGLIKRIGNGFELTFLGQLFSRNVAALFDSYLIESKEKGIYSKTI